LKRLQRELERQIPADGMHYERSPSYHAQVFAYLVECRHAPGEDPLGGNLDAALERMAQTVADVTYPDGGPALFNDAGLIMAYAPEACLSAMRTCLTPGQDRATCLLFRLRLFRHAHAIELPGCGLRTHFASRSAGTRPR
jgi:uncharacterized heparinase superfamily protein